MRYRELSDNHKRRIRYGALAVAIVLLAAGVIGFSRSTAQRSTANPDASASRQSAQIMTAPKDADDLTPAVSALRRDEAVDLVGEARRQAAAGDFTAALASLDKAKKAVPDMPEVDQARRDIEALRTPEGGFAVQLQRAQLAIDHDDTAAAEAAIAEASRLKPDAPEIAPLRAALQQAEEKAAKREARITRALQRMREAVARRDFATADSALNEAERIDIQSPSIRRARGELARARGAQSTVQE